jgi:hypothetical protein
MSEPYSDDDDPPTLQRAPSVHPVAVALAVAVAVAADEVNDATDEVGGILDEADFIHGFGDETTAVDYLAPHASHGVHASPDEAAPHASEPPDSESPADDELPTPSLPLDIAEVLQLMSRTSTETRLRPRDD